MRGITKINTALACLLIATAVLISGTHAKDLAAMSMPATWIDIKKQIDDPQQHLVKIASELHDHTDKTVKVQAAAQSDSQADNRSLRLLHEHKKITHRHRPGVRLPLKQV